MEIRKSHITCATIIFFLAALASGALMLTATLYNEIHASSELEQTGIGTYKRTMHIESIDYDRRAIVATILDRSIAGKTAIFFFVPEGTYIEQQEPLVEGGVITGFGEFKKLSFGELVAGLNIVVRVETHEDGRLYAYSISVDTQN